MAPNRRQAHWAWLVLVLTSLLLPACSTTPGKGVFGGKPSRDGYPDHIPVDIDKVPDAVPRVEPRSRYGNPPTYVVMGKTYRVMNSGNGYVERGIASWYGTKFHGERTSSGDPYDMFGMTAAHRSLPLPSYVRVTNLRNGRSVVVRVNDRGPFHADRVIDLSYTAAAKLGMLPGGTGLVEVRYLDPRGDTQLAQAPAPRPTANPPPASMPTSMPALIPASTATAGGAPGQPPRLSAPADTNPPAPQMYLQVGAFSRRDNAERLLSRLRAATVPNPRISADDDVYRVRIGPLASVAEVDLMHRQLERIGITGSRVVID